MAHHIFWRRFLWILITITLLGACGNGGPNIPTPTLAPPPTQTPDLSPTAIINRPPRIETLAASPREICPGETTILNAVVIDEDGDPLTYVWGSDVGTIINQSEDGTSARADYHAPPSAEEDNIELTVSDGKGGVDTKQTKIEVSSDCASIAEITSPRDILNCAEAICQFQVEGFTSSLVTRSDFNDLRLYILVFPVNPPGAGWYIQLQPGSIQSSDGTWTQSPSWLGNQQFPAEAGDTLKIVAVIVSKDARAKTINGTKAIDQMTGNNDDNVVKAPSDIAAEFFIVTDELSLTVQRTPTESLDPNVLWIDL